MTERPRPPRRSATRRHTVAEGRRSPESDTSGVIFIDNGRLVATTGPPTPAVPSPPSAGRQSSGGRAGSDSLPPLQPAARPRVLLEYARMQRPKRPGTDHPLRRRRNSEPARPRPSRIPVAAGRRRTARPGRALDGRRRPAATDPSGSDTGVITEVMVIEHPPEVENNDGNPALSPRPVQISESAAQVAESGAGATGGGPATASGAAARADDALKSPVDYIPRRRRSQNIQPDRMGALLAGINGWDSDDDPYSTEYRQMYKKKEGERTEKLKRSDAELLTKDEFEKNTSYLTEFVKKEGHRPDKLKQEDAELLDRDVFEKDTSYQSQFVTHSEDEYRTKGNARPSSSLAQTGEFDDGGRGSRRQSERGDDQAGATGGGGGADGGGQGGTGMDGSSAGAESRAAGMTGGGGGAGGGGVGADGTLQGGEKLRGGEIGEGARASKDGGWVNESDPAAKSDEEASKSDANANGGKGSNIIDRDTNSDPNRSRKTSTKNSGEHGEKTDSLSTDETRKWASRDASRERRERRAAQDKANATEDDAKSGADGKHKGGKKKDKQTDKSKGANSDKRDKSRNRAKGGRDASRVRGDGREDDTSKGEDRDRKRTDNRDKGGHGEKETATRQDEKSEHSDAEREPAWRVTLCALNTVW